MRKEWEKVSIIKLVSEIFAGGDVDKNKLSDVKTVEYNIPIFTNGEKKLGLYGFTNKARVEKNAITVSARGTIGFSVIRTEPFYPAVRLICIIPNEKIDISYLWYFITSKTVTSSGTSIPQLTVPMVKQWEVLYPVNIAEQQKIVEKLDKAFELIDQAKANIERNIQNAKDLFQSKLDEVFSQKGDGWIESTFSECLKLKSGSNITAKDMILGGEFPVYGGNDIAGYYDNFNIEDSVIIGRVGALCGNARYISKPSWITDNAFRVIDLNDSFDKVFLTLLMNYLQLRKYARQTAQPVISNSSLKNVKLIYPSDKMFQIEIISKFNTLSNNFNSITELYNIKLSNLEELRKSILEKAFKGELTN